MGTLAEFSNVVPADLLTSCFRMYECDSGLILFPKQGKRAKGSSRGRGVSPPGDQLSNLQATDHHSIDEEEEHEHRTQLKFYIRQKRKPPQMIFLMVADRESEEQGKSKASRTQRGNSPVFSKTPL